MKSLRLTILGLTASAAVMLAATGARGDGPSFKRESDLAAPTWTGFYLGGGIGYGFGFTELTNAQDPASRAFDLGRQGAQGVVSLGYDLRLGPRWLLGAFADFAFSEIEADLGAFSMTIDNQWGIGGRLGYVISPTTLWYGNAGYTQADFEFGLANDKITETLQGFFIGAGFEQVVSRNLSLKVEYRFSIYDQFTADVGDGITNFDAEVHSVRVGVNWRFGRE